MTTFPFQQIKIREMPAWVKALKKEGITDREDMFLDLALIDDLLILQKSQALLNRKKNLKAQLEARISLELGHKPEDVNRL